MILKRATKWTTASYPVAFWGALVASFIVQTGFGAILPLLPQFVRDRGFPLADMGTLAASYAAVSFVGQTGLGSLADRWGKKWLIVPGCLIEAVGTAGFLLHMRPWFYIVMRVVQGLGSAAVIPAAQALVADLIHESLRGRAYGLIAASSSAGFVVGPLIGGMAAAGFGLGAPFVAGAGLNLVAASVALITLPRLWRGQPRPVAPKPAFKPLMTRLWPYFVVMGAWMGLAGLYDTSWSLYMQSLGAGKWIIGLSFTLFGLPLLIFNVLGGRLADYRSERHRIILGGMLLQTATLILYVVSHSMGFSIAVTVVEAAAMSLTGPALSAAVMHGIPDGYTGMVQGWFQASGTLGAAILALASGPLLVERASHPFILGAAVLGATTLGIALVWKPWRSNRGSDTPTPLQES